MIKEKLLGDILDMRPRIFVSSTFYDLKYAREDLSNFIKAHDFEPIMFEDGDIGYTPGNALDDSCYEAMRSADMVLLIIGGSYGSPATGEQESDFDSYLSVTRKEFKTAVEEGIPVYVFIDAAVYSEYGVYEANLKNIEERKITINFRATKNINVFRFIRDIKLIGNIAITAFGRPSEIKEFLSKQWADMFKTYLKLLKEDQESKQLQKSMDNMQNLIEQMQIIIDGLGKKIINNDQEIQYDNLLKEQETVRARAFAKKITNFVRCDFDGRHYREENIENIIDAMCNVNFEIAENNLIGDEELDKFEIYKNLASQFLNYAIPKENGTIRIDPFLFEFKDDFKKMQNYAEFRNEVKKTLLLDDYYWKIFTVG